jgi:hypothetical protein
MRHVQTHPFTMIHHLFTHRCIVVITRVVHDGELLGFGTRLFFTTSGEQ